MKISSDIGYFRVILYIVKAWNPGDFSKMKGHGLRLEVKRIVGDRK